MITPIIKTTSRSIKAGNAYIIGFEEALYEEKLCKRPFTNNSSSPWPSKPRPTPRRQPPAR
ncbi:MAG TPA: hypothetical protein EYP41_11410 [Anaerolineae bacterium]|nr:hypothetical protein [Anaerolineae bacterium]